MEESPREVAHRVASDAELIAWVDKDDNLLGSLVRSDLRERGLIGRGTYIMLFNSAGELCVHRRTLSKAIYPGFWDWDRAKSLRRARLRSRTCTSTPYSQLGMLSIHRPGGNRSLEM